VVEGSWAKPALVPRLPLFEWLGFAAVEVMVALLEVNSDAQELVERSMKQQLLDGLARERGSGAWASAARGGGGRGEEQMEKEVAIVDWVALWLREEKGKR